MKNILVSIKPVLSEFGFRKAGLTFYRHLDNNIQHIIRFQKGQRSLQDQFCVNMGVFVSEAYKIFHDTPIPNVPKEYDCEIRMRLSDTIDVNNDKWWALSIHHNQIVEDVLCLLRTHGIPWFQKFETLEAIVEEWTINKLHAGFSPRGKMFIAAILALLNKQLDSDSLLKEAVQESENCPDSIFFAEKIRQSYPFSTDPLDK